MHHEHHHHHLQHRDEHASHGSGHGGHAGHADVFRKRFWWSLLLTIPIVLTSHMIMEWAGYELGFPGIDLVGPVLGSVIYFWAGAVFLSGAVQELKDRKPGMMLLIAMAITVAYAASLATSLGAFELEFWWELAALITIMLLGHWLEMKALGQAQDALSALAALLPDEAERVHGEDHFEVVPIASLTVDDVVLVRSGGRVPADGEITEGSADVDESMITGESRLIRKSVGDNVIAGTVASDSSIRVRITAIGDDTALAGIQRLVRDAQESRGRAQALADRAAAALFYVAVGAAALTFTGRSVAGDTDNAVLLTVRVLVISCPHALGLAIPLVISISSAMAARKGILVKDRLALERMRDIDAVLFDKTGTLTKGEHTVYAAEGVNRSGEDALRLAAAVEADSEHPLARAIVRRATESGAVPRATDFRSHTGRGVEADVEGRRVSVGGPALLREREVAEPDALSGSISQWRARGAAVLFVIEDSEVVGAIALEDEVRPEAREAVERLHRIGKNVAMITGDAQQVADAVAADIGIDEVFAEVLPDQKEQKVAELQRRGLRVAMVGDGVNDAPALARADVGLAIGAGTDVAIESAGVILASSDPRAVVSVIRLSAAGYRKMVQNLVWAAGYNVVAIPVAAGALAWAGIVLPPAVGALLMSVSTIVVALNAQLLRRLNLSP